MSLRKRWLHTKKQDEDVLTYALFPEVAVDYFKYRDAQESGVDAKAADTANKAYRYKENNINGQGI